MIGGPRYLPTLCGKSRTHHTSLCEIACHIFTQNECSLVYLKTVGQLNGTGRSALLLIGTLKCRRTMFSCPTPYVPNLCSLADISLLEPSNARTLPPGCCALLAMMDASKKLWQLLAQFAEGRNIFIPKSSTVDENGLIVRSPEAPRPLTLCNCDCKILTAAICRGHQRYTMRCIHPSQSGISAKHMADNIF